MADEERHDQEFPSGEEEETAKEPGKEEGRVAPERWSQQRHIFMAAVSAVIAGAILWAAYTYGDQLYESTPGTPEAPNRGVYLMPYLLNLAGVLLFILNTSRQKRERWRARDFWGDHAFRIAQSFAYNFVVLWAWASQSAELVSSQWGPNIVAFLVGLYILRVERAMLGLGERFEEILAVILPRSLAHLSAVQKREQQLRGNYKLQEIAAQYDAVRSQVSDRGAQRMMDKCIDEAVEAAAGDEHGRAQKKIAELARNFEEFKKSAGETLIPLDDLLGSQRRVDKDG
jgi:hypothetical protein